MYTAYFLINYSYSGFKHPVYIQKTIRDGDRYHPLEDQDTMDLADDRVQMEMNEYFSGQEYHDAQNCDIEVYLISAREFMETSNLFIKIDA